MPGESKDKELKIAQYKTIVKVSNTGLPENLSISHFDFSGIIPKPETTLDVDITSNKTYITNLEGLSRISMTIPIEFIAADFNSQKGVYNFICDYKLASNDTTEKDKEDIIEFYQIDSVCYYDGLESRTPCNIKIQSCYFKAEKNKFYKFQIYNFKLGGRRITNFTTADSTYLIENYS